jgi:hypothetical protein
VRKLSDAQRAALTMTVHELAWTAAREMRLREPEIAPRPDPDSPDDWLAALATLQAILTTAEQLAASAALSAAQHGADYPAIGDAADDSRQGIRRRWPGLSGIREERKRKLSWWDHRGAQLTECVRAVLVTASEGQRETARLEDLSASLAQVAAASAAQRVDLLDMVLIDAHAVALCTPPPTDRASALAIGLLAALTADAYAATNTHSSLSVRTGTTCEAPGCAAGPVVDVLIHDAGWQAMPTCHQHAVEALRNWANRIIIAYQPDVALSVLTEAYGD